MRHISNDLIEFQDDLIKDQIRSEKDKIRQFRASINCEGSQIKQTCDANCSSFAQV